MTKVEIIIQDRNGKPAITWMQQKGDPLPERLWENINIAIANAMEKGE